MKNKGIWIVILLILVMGTISTSYTRQYVKNQKESVVAAMDSGVGAAPVAEIEVSPRMVKEPEVTEAEPQAALAKTSTLARLEDLDMQIAKNHAAEQENGANYSVKARAESEFKLWEAEVENIITTLNSRLNYDKKEALAKEQREWYREREAKAIEASRLQSTRSLEELEYTLSLVAITRERAYELVTSYEQVLEY